MAETIMQLNNFSGLTCVSIRITNMYYSRVTFSKDNYIKSWSRINSNLVSNNRHSLLADFCETELLHLFWEILLHKERNNAITKL